MIAYASCLAATLVTMGCSETQIPTITGLVVDKTSGQPVSGAMVTVAYSGNTRARELWFHAATSLQSGRCLRRMAVTDSMGRFLLPSTRVGAYFGAPNVTFHAYHQQYRSRVAPVTVDSTDLVIRMWPEEQASRFSIWDGEPAQVGDQPAVTRHRYLDLWLASENHAALCDYEPDQDSLYRFFLERFEEWLTTAPPVDQRGTRSSACGALIALAPPQDPVLVERFKAMKLRAMETICVRN